MPGRPPPGRKLRIVVVDDDRDTVWTLSMILRDEGHDVYGYCEGAGVFAAVRDHQPHAVIIDLAMPEITGYAVAREIREAFGRQGPLLVAVSGKWKGQIDRLLARAVGFDHFLAKPCGSQELLELLEPLRDRPRA